MKRRAFLRNKKALSPVISEVILVASTLAISLFVLSYAASYSTVEGSSYFNKVNQNIYGLKERYILENMAFNYTDASSGTLQVWVYNYGGIDVDVKVSVSRSGAVINETSYYTNIPTGEMTEFTLDLNQVSSGNELVVKAESMRGNVEFDSYKIYQNI